MQVWTPRGGVYLSRGMVSLKEVGKPWVNRAVGYREWMNVADLLTRRLMDGENGANPS